MSTPRREKRRRAGREATRAEIGRAGHEVAAGASDQPPQQKSTNELRLHHQAEIVPQMARPHLRD